MIVSRLVALFIFLNASTTLAQSTVVIIVGASCSVKSTLCKQLLRHVNDNWKLVELDAYEDACTEAKIDYTDDDLINAVVTETNLQISTGYNVIIDTNIYDERFTGIESEFKKTILIYCPLNILLERNKRRDLILQREPKRARRAKRYVEKTFHNFDTFTNYDILIDSSTMTLDDSYQLIQNLLSSIIINQIFQNEDSCTL